MKRSILSVIITFSFVLSFACVLPNSERRETALFKEKEDVIIIKTEERIKRKNENLNKRKLYNKTKSKYYRKINI